MQVSFRIYRSRLTYVHRPLGLCAQCHRTYSLHRKVLFRIYASLSAHVGHGSHYLMWNHMRKETSVCEKRRVCTKIDQCMYHMRKETSVCEKRPIHANLCCETCRSRFTSFFFFLFFAVCVHSAIERTWYIHWSIFVHTRLISHT